MKHLRLIEAEARIAALEAKIEELLSAEPIEDKSGLLEDSGLMSIVKAEQRRAKKASYMREYMAKKRANENAAS